MQLTHRDAAILIHRMKSSLPHRLIGLVLVLALCPAATARQTSALINEALDRQVKFEFSTTALPAAMQRITAESGVKLEASPAVWDLLPYGRQTPITAKLENLTLKEALAEITQALGLQFAIRSESVEIVPMPALARLGRRASIEELRTLRALATTPLAAPVDARGIRLPELLGMIADRLDKQSPPIALESRLGNDSAAQTATIGVSRETRLLDALEAIHSQCKTATWYPWGSGVVVLTKVELINNQLAKTVSLRYSGEDVTQVLSDLSQLAGVPFVFDEGAIQHIPAEYRRIRLVTENSPITQALQSIVAFTGLGYCTFEGGVWFWNQTWGVDAGQKDPAALMVPLGNGMNLLVTRSQLPDDLRQYLDAKTNDAQNALREQMIKDGFVPTTRPAATNPDL